MPIDKRHILRLIQSLIDDGSIHPEDLMSMLKYRLSHFEPEGMRQELESWYRGLGIESVTGKNFRLSPCPFTQEEIKKAYENHEIILCVPAGISRQQLGKLFRITCWALEDPLYAEKSPKEDFWFKTPLTFEPPYTDTMAKQARRIFKDEGKLGFTLSRYLVFLSRVKHVTGKCPDQKWWTWLLAYKYDRSGFLIAGFDSEGKFSVHGWMPDFKAKFVGARYIILPEKG